MKKVIVVSQSGLPIEKEINKLSSNCISRTLSKKGKGKIQNINNWEIDGHDIKLYGFEDGEAGEENKFELPPPVDEKLLFGELLFAKLTDEKLDNLDIDEFTEFYNETMGGFEDLEDSEDSEEEDGLLVYDSDEDSDWKPPSNENESDYSDSESESDYGEEDDEEEEYEDDELSEEEGDILVFSEEEEGGCSYDSEDKVSILLYNYNHYITILL